MRELSDTNPIRWPAVAGHKPSEDDANVELVRSLYPTEGIDWVRVFASRAAEDEIVRRYGSLFHPEYELVWSEADGARQSRAGFGAHRKALRESVRPFSSFRILPERFIAHGARVLVLVRREGRTREGEQFRGEGAALFEIKDGLIYRLELFASREQARSVAGG